ncbi:hypothetical protein [Deinococcus ruber]|uniref:Uncharacterized protein n=1 Tax=Deinococcus ruber TaxID=1848197 RepID=A0A918CD17_9DEIO|nr:hypothetical protein [Deinococcus ruber]GGR16578.1 hypothetical protein GCM10008957_31530 [Deinococcus ruber]
MTTNLASTPANALWMLADLLEAEQHMDEVEGDIRSREPKHTLLDLQMATNRRNQALNALRQINPKLLRMAANAPAGPIQAVFQVNDLETALVALSEAAHSPGTLIGLPECPDSIEDMLSIWGASHVQISRLGFEDEWTAEYQHDRITYTGTGHSPEMALVEARIDNIIANHCYAAARDAQLTPEQMNDMRRSAYLYHLHEEPEGEYRGDYVKKPEGQS